MAALIEATPSRSILEFHNRNVAVSQPQLSIINTTNTSILSCLPIELVDIILTFTDPETVSAFSRATRICHSYIEDNSYLWKSLFVKYFDNPRDGHSHFDWKGQVRQRTRARHIATAASASVEDTERATETLINVVQTAHPGMSTSQTVAWLNRCIPLKFIWPEIEDNLSQSRAKLQRSTRFGPFLPRRSGRPLEVNYVHLRHLMNVQFNNIYHSHSDPEDIPLWMSRGFNATRSMTAPPSPVEGDWAGVEGEWIRFVCWMDYTDLEEYNWPDGEHEPANTVLENYVFQRPGFMEAHAFLRVSMRVVSIEKPSSPYLRPKIHFQGITMGGGINESAVKGFVSDEGGDVIRWHLYSIFGNTKRWQTEGTQVGGVQSAAGWIGCWSSPEHDNWDPAGPNWTYKCR